MDAGAADLDEVVADRGEPGEIELALGIEASGDPGAVGREQPVGADDLTGVRLTDQEVVAVRVQGVYVQARLGAVEPGSHLPGEDLVTQPLCGPYVLLVAGEGDDITGLVGFLAGSGEG